MAKKSDKRIIVGLVSEESHERIYYTTRRKQVSPDKINSKKDPTGKLSLRKYSPRLRKHVLFVETKKSLGRNEVKGRK